MKQLSVTGAALLLALTASGCAFDYTPGTQLKKIVCNKKDDCPLPRTVCRLDTHSCVSVDADVLPPKFTATADKARVKMGEQVVVTVTVVGNEKLKPGTLPVARVYEGPAAHPLPLNESKSRPRDGVYLYDYVVESTLPDSAREATYDGRRTVFIDGVDEWDNAVKDSPTEATWVVDTTRPRVEKPPSSRIDPEGTKPGGRVTFDVVLSEDLDPATAPKLIVKAPNGTVEATLDAKSNTTIYRSFEWTVRANAAEGEYSVAFDGLVDLVGNVGKDNDLVLGTVPVDTQKPVITNYFDGGRYSAVPGFNTIQVPVSINEQARVKLCLGSRQCVGPDAGIVIANQGFTPADAGIVVVNLDVSSSDREGPNTVIIQALDRSGNKATDVTVPVVLDFTAPRQIGTTLKKINHAPYSPFETPNLAGNKATIDVSFNLDEATGMSPRVESPGVTFTQLPGTQGTSFQYRGLVNGNGASGPANITITAVDLVGNERVLDPIAYNADIDSPPPATPAERACLRLRRLPWGDSTLGGTPESYVTQAACPFPIAPLGTKLAFLDRADVTSAKILASVDVLSDGGIPRTTLGTSDYPAVYVARFDTAGNVDSFDAGAIRNVEYVAALNNKVVGNTAPNPHVFEAAPFSRARQRAITPAREYAAEVATRGSSNVSSTAATPTTRQLHGYPMVEDGGNSVAVVEDTASRSVLMLRSTPNAGVSVWERRNGVFFDVTPGFGPNVGDDTLTQLAFDSVRQRLVLVKGPKAGLVSVWEWNGWQWENPQPLDGGAPLTRIDAALSPVPGASRTLMFGGTVNGALTDDQFEWDGFGWTAKAPARPTPRRSPAMAMDPVTSKIVLFGGYTVDGFDNATWEYANGTWSEFTPGTKPSPRERAVMAFDKAVGKLLLFGGVTASGPARDAWWYDSVAHTWSVAYNGATAPLAQSEPVNARPRSLLGLASDSVNSRVVYAGANPFETWEWNGLTPAWSNKTPAFPDPYGVDAGSLNNALAFDYSSTRRALVLYNNNLATKTWEWNAATGGNWTQVSVGPGPTAQYGLNMVYDPGGIWGQVIACGGNGVGSTWQYQVQNGNAVWTQTLAGTSPCGIQGALAYVTAPTGPLPSATTISLAPSGTPSPHNRYAFSAPAWTAFTPGVGPAGRPGQVVAWDSTLSQVVLFGGASGNETWVWTNGVWSNPASAAIGGPPTFAQQAMTYDANRNRTVLAGTLLSGQQSVLSLWDWDGSTKTWTENPLRGRAPLSQGAFYDSFGSRVLLVATEGGGTSNRVGISELSIQPADRPAHRFDVNLQAVALPEGAQLSAIQGDFRSGGTGAQNVVTNGVMVQSWNGWYWSDADAGTGTVGAPTDISVVVSDPARLDAMRLQGKAAFQAIPLSLNVLPSSGSGQPVQPATIATDAVEATVRYTMP